MSFNKLVSELCKGPDMSVNLSERSVGSGKQCETNTSVNLSARSVGFGKQCESEERCLGQRNLFSWPSQNLTAIMSFGR